METKQKDPTFYSTRNSPFVASLIWSSPRFSQAVILLLYFYCDWTWPMIGLLGFFSVLSLAKPRHLLFCPTSFGWLFVRVYISDEFPVIFHNLFFPYTRIRWVWAWPGWWSPHHPSVVPQCLVSGLRSPAPELVAWARQCRHLWPSSVPNWSSHSQVWSQSTQVLTLTTIMTRCQGRGPSSIFCHQIFRQNSYKVTIWILLSLRNSAKVWISGWLSGDIIR